MCCNTAAHRYELGRSNELFSTWPVEYAESNFSAAEEASWRRIVKWCSTCTLVHRAEWGDPAHADVVAWHEVAAGTGAGVAGPSSHGGKQVAVAELHNVHVVGTDGVIAAGKRVFLPSFGPQIPLHKSLTGLERVLVPKTQGSAESDDGVVTMHVPAAILLVQVFAVGYYHFLLEVVPRLIIARQREPSAPVLIPSDGGKLHGFMASILRVLRVPDSAIIKVPVAPPGGPPPIVAVGRLLCVDWVPTSTTGDQPGSAHFPAPYALNLVRSALRQPLPSATSGAMAAVATVVWVQRQKISTRRVDNEDDVLAALRRRARSHVHVFSDDPTPPVEATFALFSRADVVIGVHGAGLANAVLMRAGGHLVEYVLPERHARYYEHLAASNELAYHQIGLGAGKGLYARQSVDVDVDALHAVLDKIPLYFKSKG